jgi:hypothetical protein
MTDLVRDLDAAGLKGLTSGTEIWKDIDQGAATILVAAFDPLLNGKYYLLPTSLILIKSEKGGFANRNLIAEKGIYLDDCQVRRPSKWAADPEKAERLWKLSEKLVGETFSYGKESKL